MSYFLTSTLSGLILSCCQSRRLKKFYGTPNQRCPLQMRRKAVTHIVRLQLIPNKAPDLDKRPWRTCSIFSRRRFEKLCLTELMHLDVSILVCTISYMFFFFFWYTIEIEIKHSILAWSGSRAVLNQSLDRRECDFTWTWKPKRHWFFLQSLCFLWKEAKNFYCNYHFRLGPESVKWTV